MKCVYFDLNLIQVIESLHSAALLNTNFEDPFHSSIAARHGCHTTPMLLTDTYKISCRRLQDVHTSIFIGGHSVPFVTCVYVTVDIDLMGGSEKKLRHGSRLK